MKHGANDKCAELPLDARTSHCGKNLEGLGVTDAVPFFAPRTFETLLLFNDSIFLRKKMVLTVGYGNSIPTNGLSGSYRLRRVPTYFLAYRTKHTPQTPTQPPYLRER